MIERLRKFIDERGIIQQKLGDPSLDPSQYKDLGRRLRALENIVQLASELENIEKTIKDLQKYIFIPEKYLKQLHKGK